MDDNKVLADKFLQWFSTKYEHLKNKYYKFCQEKSYEWDEDVFSDTYLKVYEKILKSGLKDPSDKGFDGYFFISFKMNLKRSKQYCRHTKRDYNYTDEEITSLYEDYANEHQESSINKVRSDLFKDYATVYIIERVEEQFGQEMSSLFKSKYLIKGMTYKKLQEKNKDIPSVRNKVVDMKNWVRDNITKEDIMRSFQDKYDELL